MPSLAVMSLNKRQKLVQVQFLDNEEAVIKRLKQVYGQSLKDISAKAQELQNQIIGLQAALDTVEDADEKDRLKSMIQSKVYQKQYQDALKKQVGSILDNLHVEEFKTISEYLQKCYEDGFIGTLFDLQGQGIPLAMPLDQEAVVRAVQLDSPIKEGLYAHLGENVKQLKKHITAQVSRGISTGMSWEQIALQLSVKMMGTYQNPGGSLAYAMRIARTEGHRIQVQGTMDACYKAKDVGADVVKQWDSTLDGKTRRSHQKVDGEIRELDEKFSNGLMFPGDPSGGAAEVCNCRCALLQRARWALDDEFTKMNNFTKELETYEIPESYSEFKKAFFSTGNQKYMNFVRQMEEQYGTKNFASWLEEMTDKEYDKFSLLTATNPILVKDGLEKINADDTIRLGIVRDAVTSGRVSTQINANKQNRHIPGSNGFIEGRSRLDVSIEEAQKIVDELRGTGEPIFDSFGDWTNKERVVCSDYVGVYVDVSTGEETKTKNITIIYSNTGSHIVPRREDE
jgi:hypothetical protein